MLLEDFRPRIGSLSGARTTAAMMVCSEVCPWLQRPIAAAMNPVQVVRGLCDRSLSPERNLVNFEPGDWHAGSAANGAECAPAAAVATEAMNLLPSPPAGALSASSGQSGTESSAKAPRAAGSAEKVVAVAQALAHLPRNSSSAAVLEATSLSVMEISR